MKKSLFGVLAIILAVTISSFKNKFTKATLGNNSYYYDFYGLPGQDQANNLNDPNNYSYAGTSALICYPAGFAHRCGVQGATDNGFGHPDFNLPYTIRTRN